MITVGSSGGACRFWIGQSLCSSGSNPFYCGFTANQSNGNSYDTSLYKHKFESNSVTLGANTLVQGDLTANDIYTKSEVYTKTETFKN